MEFYNVGTIVNTHGIRGEVRVMVTSDFADERFQPGNTVYLFPQGATSPVAVEIDRHRRHKNFELLTFVGMENINDVEQFKGAAIKVDSTQHQELEEGTYYYDQIIGLVVETLAGEELGKIKEIIPTNGANDVWVVQRIGQKDLLLPVIDDVVKEVDLAAQKVTVDLLEGLDD